MDRAERRWIARARRYARWPAPENGSRRSFDWLAERCHEALDWLIDQPATFLHGEYYPSNIVIERDGETLGVRPVDWEMAAVGPGLLDLAALCSGAWDEAQREALRARLASGGTDQGLGLRLAQLVAQAHGGDVLLPDAAEGFAVLMRLASR